MDTLSAVLLGVIIGLFLYIVMFHRDEENGERDKWR